MKEFIEKSLRQPIHITPINIKENLPLIFTGLYHLYSVEMSGVKWVIAEPLEKTGLVQMRKHQRQIEKRLNLNCALYLKQLSSYSKDILLNEGIPFILEEKQIYLPFLGILLSCGERTLPPVRQISFLTQKLVLTALYEKWQQITVTKAAEILEITKTSASRCFDEIEWLEIPVLGAKGKARAITVNAERSKLWELIEPKMRNPVITTFALGEDLKLENKGGISALSAYTMLMDNEYSTYAVTKKEIQSLEINHKKLVPEGEQPKCVIQETGYFINFKKKNLMDPLSVMLSLSEDEKRDDRVMMAVREMLEEYVW